MTSPGSYYEGGQIWRRATRSSLSYQQPPCTTNKPQQHDSLLSCVNIVMGDLTIGSSTQERHPGTLNISGAHGRRSLCCRELLGAEGMCGRRGTATLTPRVPSPLVHSWTWLRWCHCSSLILGWSPRRSGWDFKPLSHHRMNVQGKARTVCGSLMIHIRYSMLKNKSKCWEGYQVSYKYIEPIWYCTA